MTSAQTEQGVLWSSNMVLTTAFCYETCQWGFEISIGIFISEKGAVSTQLGSVTSFLFFAPFLSSSHAHSQNTSCCFPTLHFGLWSGFLKCRLYVRSAAHSITAMGRAGDVSYGSQRVQATRWTDEAPQLRHCAWFVQQPSQKSLSFGNPVITRGGVSLPSKVLIQHNKVHFKYAGMTYRRWHLLCRCHVQVWLSVGSRLWLAIYLFLFLSSGPIYLCHIRLDDFILSPTSHSEGKWKQRKWKQ